MTTHDHDEPQPDRDGRRPPAGTWARPPHLDGGVVIVPFVPRAPGAHIPPATSAPPPRPAVIDLSAVAPPDASRRSTIDGPGLTSARVETLPPPAPPAPITVEPPGPDDTQFFVPPWTPSIADAVEAVPPADAPAARRRPAMSWLRRDGDATPTTAPRALAGLDVDGISAWFGEHHVLDRVSLAMPPGAVTALIGPSGCGKSTFLRILNRMHELIPGATLAGRVLLDGADIYDPQRKLTDARRQIGMVFQKPNPFPAMSVYDNVLAGLRLTGAKADTETKDRLVEECLVKAGLWKEVRDRLRQPGGALSGGQQQRLCIARSLAVRPRVLLMDEPCSALDPTSTRRIEETIGELVDEVTIVIVTHNMQQAARVSNFCAFFLAEQGTPGYIVEHGPTDAMFNAPQDPRTADYVAGRFG